MLEIQSDKDRIASRLNRLIELNDSLYEYGLYTIKDTNIVNNAVAALGEIHYLSADLKDILTKLDNF